MRRNRFFLLLAAVAMLLPLLSLSCIAGPTTPTSATPADPVAHQSDITTLNNKIAALATDASVQALETRMAQAEGKITSLQAAGTGNTYTKTETYTKAEVDAIISALKSNQSWITDGSSSGSSGGSPTGTVVFTTNPVSIQQIYSASTGGGQSVFYTMHVVNQSSTWQYVKPIITMTVSSSYSSRTVTGITVTMSSGGCSLTGSEALPVGPLSTVGNFSVSPAIGTAATATTSFVIIPISGCNGSGEFQVGAGQPMDILIQISGLTTSDVTLWNVTNSISSRAL